MDEVLWRPSSIGERTSSLTRYTDWLTSARSVEVSSYEELWQWSVDNIHEFWLSIWDFFEVDGTYGGKVIADSTMPGAEWFPCSRVNYAEHLLRHIDEDGVAVIWRNDRGDRRTLTGADLRHRAAALAATFRAEGIGPGDVVAGYLPNVPETVIAFLATASLGAVWTNCAPEFGTPSVLDRLRQVAPRALVYADHYSYSGRWIDRRSAVAEVRSHLSSLTVAVRIPYGPDELAPEPAEGVLEWDAVTTDAWEWAPERLDFAHPLWILYSSGTSGPPKALVHGHGGVLLEHLKSHGLHLNLGADDVFHWHTSTGWVMWNLQIAGLLVGSRIVLFDGNPAYPGPDAIWQLAEDERVTTLGASAALFEHQMNAGLKPGRDFDLRALACLGSTGSPLSRDTYEWVYDAVKSDVWLMSFSGGTDVATAFVGGNPNLPVRLGELQCRWLGVAVSAWDENGQVSENVGELVVTSPMPSMPLYLVDDPDGSRLVESYFDVYPGIWRHGDWIEFRPSGGAVIHGRSDSTINRRGIRMGTSEIYSALASFGDVEDSLAVDISDGDGASRLVVFVVLSEGVTLKDSLHNALRVHIRENLSPRHVPDEFIQARSVPRTLNGKRMELPVKRLLEGARPEQVLNSDAMTNPEAVAEYVAHAAEYQHTSA